VPPRADSTAAAAARSPESCIMGQKLSVAERIHKAAKLNDLGELQVRQLQQRQLRPLGPNLSPPSRSTEADSCCGWCCFLYSHH
jgi:hypothetical protein